MCWTKGCKFNGDFYLKQWIEYHFKGRHEELKQRLIPLVVEQVKKRAQEKERQVLKDAGGESAGDVITNHGAVQSRRGAFTDGKGESSQSEGSLN